METVTVHQFFLKPAKVSPLKIIPVPLTEAAIEMVKANMGVVVMARWSLKNHLLDGSLRTVKVGKAGLKRKHYVALIRKKNHPVFVQHFLDFLQKEIQL